MFVKEDQFLDVGKKAVQIISAEQIDDRIDELATQITQDYSSNGSHLVVVGVMKGAAMFTTDLTKRIPLDVRTEYIRIKSYIGETAEEIESLYDIDICVAGKDVLVLEDIVDTGNSLIHLREHFEKKNPRSLRFASLFVKDIKREKPVKLDYVGFEIGDKFVVGRGLDLDERGRHYGALYELEDI